MKICLYSNTAFPRMGGQEVVVDELARQYQSKGHEVVVFCPEPIRLLRSNDRQYPYRVIRHPRQVSTRWFAGWYELALRRFYRHFQYELIHCHNVYPNAYLAVRHRRKGGPPVVITSHGGDVRIDNPRFRKPGLLERHQFAVQGADALLSISPFTDQGFLSLGARPQSLHSISNGVHVREYAKSVSRPRYLPDEIHKDLYILYLGRLVASKGVDILLHAASLQQQKGDAVKCLPKIVICGDGKQRASLEQLSHQLGLQGRAYFLGNVQGSTKLWLLQNAAMQIVPTKDWEAFPLVLLEGFAAGCPIIVSDAPGLSDLVTHEQTGWVVPRNNSRALVERINYLWQQPALARTIGEAGQLVAENHIGTILHVNTYNSSSSSRLKNEVGKTSVQTSGDSPSYKLINALSGSVRIFIRETI